MCATFEAEARTMGTMPQLRIDFQDGFAGEPITLRVNGDEVMAGSPRTAKLTGKAGSASVNVPAGAVEIEIDLPGRETHRISLRVERDTFLGISRTARGFEHIERSAPFGYA
jgi:hypothetical protein